MNEARLPYRDRRQAGRVLAQALQHYRGRSGLLVLALPRGAWPWAWRSSAPWKRGRTCAVGLWYRDVPQATDQEVHELLDEARREQAAIH